MSVRLLLVTLVLAQSATAAALERYDLGRAERVRLPHGLREVSGLASDAGGRLFAHDDEIALIHELDPSDGSVLKRFSVGRRRAARGDFEGIAIAGTRFVLVTSAGTLLTFSEGDDGAGVDYEIHRTGLGDRCAIEGLAYDATTDALLLPCKTPTRRALRGHLVVFSVPLSTFSPRADPRVLVSPAELREAGLENGFRPSAIEVDPATGHLVLASAHDGLLELSPDGRVLETLRLGPEHRQAEGLTFGPDGSLWIADEGTRAGTLTHYRPPRTS